MERRDPSLYIASKHKGIKGVVGTTPIGGRLTENTRRTRFKGTVSDKKNLQITLELKKNTFQSQHVCSFDYLDGFGHIIFGLGRQRGLIT